MNLWHSDTIGSDKFWGLTKTNMLGGVNSFMAYSFLVIGVMSMILVFIFLIRKIQRPRGILKKRIEEMKMENEEIK